MINKIRKGIPRLFLREGFWFMLLIIFFGLRFYNILFEGNIIGPFGDNTYKLAPLFSYMSKIRHLGEDPLWVQSVLGGYEMFDSAKWSIYYPFFFLDWIDYKTGLDTIIILGKVSLFHVFLYYIGFYILFRILFSDYVVSFVGASVAIINPTMSCLSGWIEIVAAYAWFPIFLAGIILIFERTKSLWGSLLLGISILGFTANPAQPLIHALYIGVPVILAGFYFKVNKHNYRRVISSYLLSGIFVFGFSAVSLIPMVMNYPRMLRWIGGTSLVGLADLPFASFEGHTAWGWSELVFLHPEISRGLGSIYFGPLGCFFGIIFLYLVITNRWASNKGRWIVWPLFLITIYFLLSTLGYYPFKLANWYLPFINKIREPLRHAFAFSFSFSILVTFGFKFIYDFLSTDRKTTFNISILISLLLMVFFFPFRINYSTCFFLALFFTISTFFYFKKPKLTLITIIIILLFSNNYFTPNKSVNIPHNKLLINSPTHQAALNVLEELGAFPDSREFRFQVIDKELPYHRWSMFGCFHRLKSLASSFDPLPYSQMMELMFSTNSYYYMNMWGVKWYIINKKDKQPEFSLLKKKASFKNHNIYENEFARPRVYLADGIKAMEVKSFKAFNSILKKNKNESLSRKSVYLSTVDYSKLVDNMKNITVDNSKKNKINSITETHNAVSLTLSLKKESVLVLNEYYNDHWKIFVNGTRVDGLKVNYNQIGIPLNLRSQKVEFRYEPFLVKELRFLQYLTYCLWGMVLLITIKKEFQLNIIRKDAEKIN